MAPNTPDLLQRPLYIFDLPKELLSTLALKDSQSHQITEPVVTVNEEGQSADKDAFSIPDSADGPSGSNATSCGLCDLKFANLTEQRQHVRSDLHGYNLKQKIKGLKPVSEAQFDKLIGELDESISGSDSSETESDGEEGKAPDSTLTALLKRQAKISTPEKDGATNISRGGNPLVWLGSSALPPNISLGVYKVLFDQQDLEYLIDSIRHKQLEVIGPQVRKAEDAIAAAKKAPTYFLCMMGGGHFAAMVVSVNPRVVHTHKGAERQAIVLAHKTFHRYTTRRKQGGAQSTADGNGVASTAGSSLRRANEAALTKEIRELLDSWRTMIKDCELVFIRATGKANRATLFGPYDGQVLTSKDPRIRGFPFTTRRATQSELMRAFIELTRVKVSHVNEAALKALPIKESSPAPKPKAPKPPKPTAEEESALLHTSQLSAFIRRSKIPALTSYISSNDIDLKSFRFFPESQHLRTPTPLHFAASLGHVPVITALLTKHAADPTIRNAETKTPYDLAKDRPSRDAFRLARYTLGESAWDWQTAGVGAAMSAAEGAQRAKQEKEDKEEEAKKEAERRKNETERLRKEDQEREDKQREKRVGKGNVLGNTPTGAEKREMQGRGLTPEMRMQLERERRARAAEARMRGAG